MRRLPGPRGSEAWAGSRRPPLRPLPGAAPAARPAGPARAPHAGPAVPGRRTSSPWASTSCPAAEPPTPALRPLPDTQRATTRPRCPCPAPRRRAGPRGAPGGRSPWWGLCGPLPSRLGRTLRAAAAAALPPAAAPGSSRALPPPSPAHAQCGSPEPSREAAPARGARERRQRAAGGPRSVLRPGRAPGGGLARAGKGRERPPQRPGGCYGVGSGRMRRGQAGVRGPSGSSARDLLFCRENSLSVLNSPISKGQTLFERPV